MNKKIRKVIAYTIAGIIGIIIMIWMVYPLAAMDRRSLLPLFVRDILTIVGYYFATYLLYKNIRPKLENWFSESDFLKF
jgi:hypothetical protein